MRLAAPSLHYTTHTAPHPSHPKKEDYYYYFIITATKTTTLENNSLKHGLQTANGTMQYTKPNHTPTNKTPK